MEKRAKNFIENFQTPEWVQKVIDEEFPVARNRGVLLKREHRSEEQVFATSGIIIPATSNANKFIGRIYAVGPEVKDLHPGMRVIYNSYADQTILYKGQEYVTMSDLDVFFIVPESAQTLEANIQREGRKQYSHDEMPDIEPSKEEKQEEQEEAMNAAEEIKKDLKKGSNFQVIKNDSKFS